MSFTAAKDSQSGDHFFDISKTDKRLVRATVKTYEKTGNYVFLKLFKKADISSDDYKFEQRIGLTLNEFLVLVTQSGKINAALKKSESDSEEETKPPAAKRVRKTPKAKIYDEVDN